MEDVDKQRDAELVKLKNQLDDEFHNKVLLEEQDKVVWDPRVMSEPIRRSSSFVCTNYHITEGNRPKPKIVPADVWQCQSQALRQLSMVPRFGPKKYYINNRTVHNIPNTYLGGDTTQALGLCYDPMTVSSL